MKLDYLAWITQGFIVSCLIASNAAQAQIVPDGTLGGERSRLTPINPTTDRIEGGALRGVNLFHSFREFNVGTGRGVYFANPAAVQNIFSRVTGGNVSNINGTLGVLGQANLFLLNPNGIIFGPNARLDVAGSFFASTASGFTFPDGSEFSATNPQAAPLLTVSLMPGLQRGGIPGAIANAGNLSVGKDLTLSGGTVTSTGLLAAPQGQLTVEATVGDARVRDVTAQTATLYANNNLILEESQLRTTGDLNLLAQNTVRVRDSVANPFVAWAGGKLLVQGNQTVDIFALNHPNSGLVSGGDMVLRSANTVGGDAHYWAGGRFQIEKPDGILGSLSSPYDPIIRARGDVNFTSYEGASLHILAGGSVNIGSIVITGSDTSGNSINPVFTPDLARFLLSDGTEITIDGSSQPTVDIRAGTTDFQPPSLSPTPIANNGNTVFPNNTLTPLQNPLGTIVGTVNPDSEPASGNANITIGRITNVTNQNNVDRIGQTVLTTRYKPNSISSRNIQIGLADPNIKVIDVYGDVILDSGGEIRITGKVDTTVNNQDYPNDIKNAGDIKLLADGRITIASDLKSEVTGGSGKGGDITIISNNGGITSTGIIKSSTPIGKGGNIYIEAKGGDIQAKSIRSFVGDFPDNASGNPDRDISKGGMGDAGAITLIASGGITFLKDPNINNIDYADLISLTSFTGSGKAGDISLEAKGGSINTSAIRSFVGEFSLIDPTTKGEIATGGQGQAGNVTLTAESGIKVFGRISAFSGGSNDPMQPQGGTVTLTAHNKLQGNFNNGKISVSSIRSFVGGVKKSTSANISECATGLECSGKTGKAGNIILTSENGGEIFVGDDRLLAADKLGDILSFTGKGEGGTISLTAGGEITILGKITSKVLTEGLGGGVTLKTPGTISLKDIIASSNQTTAVNGNSSNYNAITIESGRSLTLSGVTLKTTNSGTVGLAGDIKIYVDGDVNIFNSILESTGNFGRILIDKKVNNTPSTKKITISSSTLNTNSTGLAKNESAGDIVLDALEKISITNSNLTSTINYKGYVDPSNRKGNPADIRLTGGSVEIIRSKLKTNTTGTRDGGEIFITARDSGKIDLLKSSVATTTSGKSFSVIDQNGSSIIQQGGNAGDITLKAGSNITLTGVQDISLPTQSACDFLVLGSCLDAGTSGSGQAGNISLTSNQGFIKLEQNSKIYTDVASGSGSGGKITIEKANSVSLTDNSELTAQTTGSSNAGTISTTVSDFIEILSGSRLNAKSTTDFNAGNIVIIAPNRLTLEGQGSQIVTEATAKGNSGSIEINTRELNVQNGAQISAKSNIGISQFVKLAGLETLKVTDGSITASTETGQAGNLTVDATDSIQLSGKLNGINSGLFVRSTGDGGKAGSLIVTTGNLTITDDAQINLDSQKGAGGAGDVKIFARTIALTNRGQITTKNDASQSGGDITLHGLNGQPLETLTINNPQRDTKAITAETNTGRAGKITIDVRDRLQSNNGKITTSAKQGSGGAINISARNIRLYGDSDITTFVQEGADQGGNITLNAFTIVALGDSDILAYAKDGIGGNISFGKTPILLAFRYFVAPKGTVPSTLDKNRRVDINASGALGDGSIDFPALDPSRGLTSLPTGLEDPNKRLDTTCATNSTTATNTRANSQFVIIGRGGLPPSPNDPLTPDAIQPLQPPPPGSPAASPPPPTSPSPQSIQEAQGFIRLPDGRIRFVAQATTVTPTAPWQPIPSCSYQPPTSEAPHPTATAQTPSF